MSWRDRAADDYFSRTPPRGRRGIAPKSHRAAKRRTRHTAGNPIPAIGALSGLTKVFKIPSFRYDKAKMEQRANAVKNLAVVASGAYDPAMSAGVAKTKLQRVAQGLEWPGQWDQIQKLAQQYLGQVPGAAPAAAGFGQTVAGFFGTPGGAQVIRTAVGAAKPRRGRQRYPAYTDRYGRQRYSTKPPGSQYRLPAGATAAPGAPYSFFTGKLGAGGFATTAGQVAVAAAAGAAAYLVTQRLLEHLGGRAQRAEEAGVNAALAFRQARADFQQQHGRPMNKAELKEAGDAMKAQLVELGYDPVTFQRTRGAVSEFLETYNPFGG